MADVVEIDCATGVVTERAFTSEEIIQREQDAAAVAAAEATRNEAELKRQQDTQSAADKLAALGLTMDEIAALIGS